MKPLMIYVLCDCGRFKYKSPKVDEAWSVWHPAERFAEAEAQFDMRKEATSECPICLTGRRSWLSTQNSVQDAAVSPSK